MTAKLDILINFILRDGLAKCTLYLLLVVCDSHMTTPKETG